VHAVLVDASALIALLDADDEAHERCVDALTRIHAPLATVWPALTEAMHLLADLPRAVDALCDMIEDSKVLLLAQDKSQMPRVKALMRKYADLPMDFADASLVCAAEQHRLTRVVTLDRHFTVYRLPGRSRFTVLPAPGSRS
jgi:hypothetical protein